MSKFISIVIPTYNRKDVLAMCLHALGEQVCDYVYEIIIIDDGSTDGTCDVVKNIQKKSKINIRYYAQKNKGPASARNIGVKYAEGKVILFLGDDIIVTPALLDHHIEFHHKYPKDNFAMLGYVTWSPQIKVTPFMYWLENGGSQFQYYKLQHQGIVKVFWTCNVSLKKKFMLKEGMFDENFPYAAHEDTELGFRLQKKGLQICFDKEAVAYHYHLTKLEDFCQRQRKVGKSAVILNKKWPSFFKLPLQDKIWKQTVFNILKPGIPYLGKVVSSMDLKNIKVPSVLYKFMMLYHTQIGVMEAFEDID